MDYSATNARSAVVRSMHCQGLLYLACGVKMFGKSIVKHYLITCH